MRKVAAQIIDELIGVKNLYKIDPWTDPNGVCKHNNSVFCEKCAKELEGDTNE